MEIHLSQRQRERQKQIHTSQNNQEKQESQKVLIDFIVKRDVTQEEWNEMEFIFNISV